ncbi:MAG: hypothetical protein ACXWUN_12785 [Allosphingosinicella sp.]
MSEILEWFATIVGIVAALLIAADLGRRATGLGFVLFTFASIAWIGYGLVDEEGGLMTQNIVLFVINLIGVYRYLIRKQRPAPAA